MSSSAEALYTQNNKKKSQLKFLILVKDAPACRMLSARLLFSTSPLQLGHTAAAWLFFFSLLRPGWMCWNRNKISLQSSGLPAKKLLLLLLMRIKTNPQHSGTNTPRSLLHCSCRLPDSCTLSPFYQRVVCVITQDHYFLSLCAENACGSITASQPEPPAASSQL